MTKVLTHRSLGRQLQRILSYALRRTFGELLRRRREVRTYAALRGLDDYLLRDLGFNRSELMSVAAHTARWGDESRVQRHPAPQTRIDTLTHTRAHTKESYRGAPSTHT